MNKILAAGYAWGNAGFRVFPLRYHSKLPAIKAWQDQATDNLDRIHSWFSDPRHNIGIACGPQPNGINLVALDVDTKHGGDITWAKLLAEHSDLATLFSLASVHRTPYLGYHYFIDSPIELSNTQSTLGKGIDTRATGGFVVAPPSIIADTDTGELLSYSLVRRGSQLSTNGVVIPTPQLVSALTPARNGDRQHAPRESAGTSPLDQLRSELDWHDLLGRYGWQLDTAKGNEEFWRHPQATNERSACLHLPDGPLTNWSSNVLQGVGKINRDGSNSCSIVDFYAWHEGISLKALARAESNQRREVDITTRRAATSEPEPSSSTYRLPVVDTSYWEGSSQNAHILAAARASLIGPDALDLVVYALQSCLVPPAYLLPRIVGGQQPLNMLSCLVAPTGYFKTATLDCARDLLGPLPPWVISIGMGSGEGIGRTFLKEEMKEGPKGNVKTGRLVRNDVKAAFFEADEGSGLAAQAERKSATIIANLCKSWSGSTLGEANADDSTRRHVLDRDYRIAALVNIQPINFAKLFSIANTGTGLTGRFMFSGTADYDIPDEAPPWPGRLELPRLDDMPITLEIDPDIIAEAQARIRALHRSASLSSEVDAIGQNAAVIARMAGIRVLFEGRRRITRDDWELAKLRAVVSANCLETLASWSVGRQRDADHVEDERRALRSDHIDTIKNRQAVARMAESIRRKVQDEPVGLNRLARAITSKDTRYRFDAALELAVSNGWVKVDDQRVMGL